MGVGFQAQVHAYRSISEPVNDTCAPPADWTALRLTLGERGSERVLTLVNNTVQGHTAAARTKVIEIAQNSTATSYFLKRLKADPCVLLYKAGKDHCQASSYRQITLLNVMSKVCEQLILRRPTTTVEMLQPPSEHRFMRARGTASQILRTGKIITDALWPTATVSP
ncbi:hypothetical protein EVAR_76261_1 [Eumeta japonica]|uniref:Uncharacterized protein n=1 Tax=Eumeta variegata TaxID=151549 RepID=A0A4C1UQA9_EUMVA|nr:hypothetical protein EVAR_76261_1 [Eumeta japonica]